MPNAQETGRTLADIIGDIRDEAKEFLQTRVQLLRSELEDSAAAVKRSLPLIMIAMPMLWTAYLLFTLALVSLLAIAFRDNPYRWVFAFGIVAITWGIIGFALAVSAQNKFRRERCIRPKLSKC